MISPEEKREKMLTDPVELLVCKMAVPTIITMLITAFYNMADTFFVGRLDTVSTAAVGLALPLMNVIQAIGFFFGHGSGNYMSRMLGKGDEKAASRMADTSAILSLSLGTLLALLGLLNIRPLAAALGATPDLTPALMESTVQYVSVMLIGVPFIMTSFTMNNQLRFQGNAFYGMIGMAGGAVLNVILDPVFIFILDMGVKGAAAATVISQIVSFLILLKMSGRLPLRKPDFYLSGEIISAIFRFGTPSLCRQGIMSIASVTLNHAAGNFGEAAVAAVSVVNKIVMLGGSAVIGFGQGFQPVCGFNNGAKRYDRIRKTFAFCIRASTAFMLLFGGLAFAFAPSLIAFFRDDPQVIEAGIPMLRFQCVTAPLQGIIIMTNMLVQNMGRTFSASFLAVARQGIFFIPLIIIMTKTMGITGLCLAQSAADLLTAAVTVFFTVGMLRNLKELENEKGILSA